MLAIAGNNSEAYKLPVFETEHEIWVLNGKGTTLPRYDLVFQMHLPCDWGRWMTQKWLKQNTSVPVIMREVHSEIPMSQRYPFEAVFDMLKNVRHRNEPLQYFTSSISWAIAMAVLQSKPKIALYGLDMAEHEYVLQKDCFAFWVGFAAGRGLELDINCADSVFKKTLYGSYPLQ